MGRDFPQTHDELRYIEAWRSCGGSQHGPKVEHVYMQYEQFFKFCRALEEAAATAAIARFKSGLDAVEAKATESKDLTDQMLALTIGVGKRFDQLLRAVRTLLEHYDSKVCRHEKKYHVSDRVICDRCGTVWLDRSDGQSTFKPYEDPPDIAAARALLAVWP